MTIMAKFLQGTALQTLIQDRSLPESLGDYYDALCGFLKQQYRGTMLFENYSGTDTAWSVHPVQSKARARSPLPSAILSLLRSSGAQAQTVQEGQFLFHRGAKYEAFSALSSVAQGPARNSSILCRIGGSVHPARILHIVNDKAFEAPSSDITGVRLVVQRYQPLSSEDLGKDPYRQTAFKHMGCELRYTTFESSQVICPEDIVSHVGRCAYMPFNEAHALSRDTLVIIDLDRVSLETLH